MKPLYPHPCVFVMLLQRKPVVQLSCTALLKPLRAEGMVASNSRNPESTNSLGAGEEVVGVVSRGVWLVEGADCGAGVVEASQGMGNPTLPVDSMNDTRLTSQTITSPSVEFLNPLNSTGLLY